MTHKRSPQARFRRYIKDNAFYDRNTKETINELSEAEMETECRRLFGWLVGGAIRWWEGEVLRDRWGSGSEELDWQYDIELDKDIVRRPLVYGRQ